MNYKNSLRATPHKIISLFFLQYNCLNFTTTGETENAYTCANVCDTDVRCFMIADKLQQSAACMSGELVFTLTHVKETAFCV